jgi:alpha-amylase/alpha-mannosidase (GH57 family)
VSRPKLAVHGHFYQPERRDPFSGEIAPQPAAAPYRDWNARIDAECYKPNAERGNLRHISYDLGPRWPAGWPTTTPRLTGASSTRTWGRTRRPDCGNAMAQAYHHAILPLASLADRRTEIRWGLRDFELRFGRRPTGIWLPETAVDLPTLRILAE